MLGSSIDWNNVVLLLIAVMTAVNTYYSRKTEKNTNSMKDALVASTATVSDLEGHARGLKEGREEGAKEKRS